MVIDVRLQPKELPKAVRFVLVPNGRVQVGAGLDIASLAEVKDRRMASMSLMGFSVLVAVRNLPVDRVPGPEAP